MVIFLNDCNIFVLRNIQSIIRWNDVHVILQTALIVNINVKREDFQEKRFVHAKSQL